MIRLCSWLLLSVLLLGATVNCSQAQLWYELLPKGSISIDGNMTDWAEVKSVDMSHGPNTDSGIIDIKYARSATHLYWYVDIGNNQIAADSPLTLVFTGPNENEEDTALFIKYDGNQTVDYYEASYIEHVTDGLQVRVISSGSVTLPQSDPDSDIRRSTGSGSYIEGKFPFEIFGEASYEDIEIGFFTELDFQNPARGILSYLTPLAKVYSVNKVSAYGTAIDIEWEWEFFDSDVSDLQAATGIPEHLSVEFTAPNNDRITFATPTWEFDEGKGGGQYFYSDAFVPQQGFYQVDLALYSDRLISVPDELGIETLRQLPVVSTDSVKLEKLEDSHIKISWDKVSYSDPGSVSVPLYYRIKVYDSNGNRIVKSSNDPYLTAAEFTFDPDGNSIDALVFKIEVFDSDNYDDMMNKSTTGQFQVSRKKMNIVPVFSLLLN